MPHAARPMFEASIIRIAKELETHNASGGSHNRLLWGCRRVSVGQGSWIRGHVGVEEASRIILDLE